jgi:putative ABC transport system substrate-binding protein
VAFAAEHRLPFAANNRESVEEGCLMSYGVKASGLFSDLAIYVDRILKGEKASDLPIQRPTRFELTVNARTGQSQIPDVIANRKSHSLSSGKTNATPRFH